MRFRLVDRVFSWEPERSIRGMKTVSLDECLLKDAWGGPPAMPETLLMESIFQLANWLIMLSSDFERMGALVRIKRIDCHRPVLPGERVRMEATALRYRQEGVLLEGHGMVGGEEVVRGRGCMAALVPLEEYEDPDYLRALSREIIRPE